MGDKKDVKTPALRAFGRDLTELAKKGELDPVIGRKSETRTRNSDPVPAHQKQPGAAR